MVQKMIQINSELNMIRYLIHFLMLLKGVLSKIRDFLAYM